MSLKLTFSSKIVIKNLVSERLAKEEEKVTCLKGKSTCPGRPDGGFFKPY